MLSNGFYYKLLAEGKIPPDGIEPDIGPFIYYIHAFDELTTCRSIGMGVGPIPFTSIVEYYRIFGIEGESFEEFLHIIRKMDEKFLEAQAKRSSKSGANPNQNNKNHSRHKR